MARKRSTGQKTVHMTRKASDPQKNYEVEGGGHVPQCPTASDTNAYCDKTSGI